jgi:hypothetical protein
MNAITLGVCGLFMTREVRWITPADRDATRQRRRRQQEFAIRAALPLLGEEVLRAIFQAVKEGSEQPLTQLHPLWREKAIAAFREARAAWGAVVVMPRMPPAPRSRP